jgi:hypothetical protein
MSWQLTVDFFMVNFDGDDEILSLSPIM